MSRIDINVHEENLFFIYFKKKLKSMTIIITAQIQKYQFSCIFIFLKMIGYLYSNIKQNKTKTCYIRTETFNFSFLRKTKRKRNANKLTNLMPPKQTDQMQSIVKFYKIYNEGYIQF